MRINKEIKIHTLVITLALVFTLVITSSFAFAGTMVSKWDGKTYTHSSMFDNYIAVEGLDIYAGQETCNFEKMKADGVDFVIIRIGYRGYGIAGNMYEDSRFFEYYQKAKEAGMLIGTYFYSQAHSEDEARAEVLLCDEIMKRHGLTQADFELPLFMDFEYSPVSSGRLTSGKYSKSTLTNTALAWMDEAIKLGYNPGIYANLSFLNNAIDGETLSKTYPIWVAQYYSKCNATHEYNWWQYGSSGSVDGVGSKRCDTNVWYVNLNPTPSTNIIDRNSVMSQSGLTYYDSTMDYSIIPVTYKSIIDANISISGYNNYTYVLGEAFEPSININYAGLPLTEGVDYNVRYIKNSQAGTAYIMVIGMGQYRDYQLLPFTVNPNKNVAGLTVSGVSDVTYTGKEVKPDITILAENGRELRQNRDYIVSYTGNNTNVGTVRANVEFTGNYIGTKTVSFNILKGAQTISMKEVTELDTENGDYDLEVSLGFKDGKVTYKSSNESVLKVSDSGIITPLARGTAKVTVEAKATENYTGAKKELTINVTAPKLVQEVTTKYTKYTRDFDGKGFNVKANTSGDGVITYLSNNTEIATIDDEGNVEIVGNEYGTVELYVTASETEEYASGMKTVYLTVNEPTEEQLRAIKDAKIIDGVNNTTIKAKTVLQTKGIKLSWTKSKGYKVDYYEIFRSTKKNVELDEPYFTTTKTSYTNTKALKKNTRYYFIVRGVREVNGEKYYTTISNLANRTFK